MDEDGYPETYKGCEIKVFHLAPDILVVAKQGYGGEDWAAYAATDKVCDLLTNPDGTVRSRTPEECVGAVVENGTKLQHSIAATIFPSFEKKYRWRT